MEEMMEDLNEENLMLNHEALAKRIKRSLYYDPIKNPDKDTLSFSVTSFAVDGFRKAAPSPLRKLGHRYAARVARDACVSPCSLLLGVIYIERLKSRNPEYLQQISSSDLFLVSMMVASKYLYDEGVDEEVFNDEWATSGGLKVSEVNLLEMEFLRAVDWKIYVHPKEFNEILSKAEASVARINGLKRGWMTYTDLRSLLDSYDIAQNIAVATKYLYHVSSLCLLAYGSFLLATGASLFALTNLMKPQTATLPSSKFQIQNRVRLEAATDNRLQPVNADGELDENCIENHDLDESEITKIEEEIKLNELESVNIPKPKNLTYLSQLTPPDITKARSLQCVNVPNVKSIAHRQCHKQQENLHCKSCAKKWKKEEFPKFKMSKFSAHTEFQFPKFCRNKGPMSNLIDVIPVHLSCSINWPTIKNITQY